MFSKNKEDAKVHVVWVTDTSARLVFHRLQCVINWFWVHCGGKPTGQIASDSKRLSNFKFQQSAIQQQHLLNFYKI